MKTATCARRISRLRRAPASLAAADLRGTGRLRIAQGARACAIRERIEAYFAGKLDAIDTIKVATGGTPFQQKVWRALRRFQRRQDRDLRPFAERIGAADAVRAVGAANGANPVSVIVPCHRLIGANGSLIRYGGGIERKHWLLRHEGARLSADQSCPQIGGGKLLDQRLQLSPLRIARRGAVSM